MQRLAIAVLFVLLLPAAACATDVTLTVEEPAGVARAAWPVTSGIPLAQGALTDDQAAALFPAEGKTEIPLQTEVLARWPDGSVRWLLLDFQTDLAARQKRAFVLRWGPGIRRRAVERPLWVETNDRGVILETGSLRLAIPADRFRLLNSVWFDADRDGKLTDREQIVLSEAAGVSLSTPDGKTFRASQVPAEVTVEQTGPLRACVRVTGKHTSADGSPMFRYVVRLHVFRGKPCVRILYTFINDSQESLMARIQSLNLVFALPGKTACVLDGRPTQGGRLFQSDESHYQLDGRPAGARAAGWAAMGGEGAGMAVGLRECWQNWPKSIECRNGQLTVGLCPELPVAGKGDRSNLPGHQPEVGRGPVGASHKLDQSPFPPGLYDGRPLLEESKLYYNLRDGQHALKCGVARTHELWTTFFSGKPDAAKLSEFFRAAEEPLLATCQPAYACATKAAGEFPPADPVRYDGYDAWLDRALEAHLKLRDRDREYGMLNYGDWYGERGVNWGNLEYDLAHGLFLQYLRTGDRRYWQRAEQAARHHVDVDVVHATNPHLKNPWGPPPTVGDIWLHCVGHTGGYYHKAALPVGETYQMGHSTNFGHVWVSGDLDYYHLTGDRRALEVAVEMADAMATHMPTAYGDHIRAMGWPMILVLDAYQTTGNKKYLAAATKNWEVLKKNLDWQRGWVVRLAKGHCLHDDRRCHGNVPFMEGLTLSALARYHRITGDPEVLRAITVGIDQMIRECWQEDVKTFRYTACPLSSKTPYVLLMLSAEAMAYEATLTGNQEHLRILREGVRAAIPKGDGNQFGKNLAQMLFFAPHGLTALEKRP
jgi:hypothetical protein